MFLLLEVPGVYSQLPALAGGTRSSWRQSLAPVRQRPVPADQRRPEDGLLPRHLHPAGGGRLGQHHGLPRLLWSLETVCLDVGHILCLPSHHFLH